ncbi:MAG TPA: transposase domain-containing protein [Fibrobacteria bacterium]|nr:transposase domain-containing protein [Fibrobacteria bacterium]
MTAVDEVWLSTQEAARLLQLSVDAMRRRLGQYVTREVCGFGRGGKRLEISLASLGDAAVARFHAAPDREDVMAGIVAAASLTPTGPDDRSLIARAFEQATNRAREQFQRRARVLDACEGVSGRHDLELWTEAWNKEHPDDQVSTPTIYRWRHERDEYGMEGCLKRDCGPRTTVRDEWYQWFQGLYLNQARQSVWTAWFKTLGMAVKAGHIRSESEFPSQHAFMRRLRSDFSPANIELHRHGNKRWYDRHGLHVRRDYSDVQAGRCWVGDTHTVDVFVRVGDEPVPVTCYLTLFMDMKSYVPMGWHFHTSAPSAANSMRALKHGIERFGVPDEILVDHGREYMNRDFAGITRKSQLKHDDEVTTSLMSMLRIKIRFAIVQNARAKPIERQFEEFKDKFSRNFPTFKGGNVLEKPDQLKSTLKRGDIILFADLVAYGNQFLSEIFPAMPCFGEHHQGRKRREVLESEMTPLQTVSPETLSRLVTKTISGRIKSQGFYASEVNSWWWAEWMVAQKGNTVTLRYDPDNLTTTWCYSDKGVFLGEATLRQALGALIRPEDSASMEGLKSQMRDVRGERRLTHALQRNIKKFTPQEQLEAMAAAAQARPVTIATGATTRLTQHDHTAAQIRREKRIQRIDITQFDEAPEPPRPVLRAWEDEPISAAV